MLRSRDFRRITLGMDDAVEGAHMQHPDFRVNGRIFATLNAEETVGVVMLTPEQQKTFMEAYPAMFSPAAGAWGRGGSTRVHLDAADEDAVGEAVTLAWQNKAAAARRKSTLRSKPSPRATTRTSRPARRR